MTTTLPTIVVIGYNRPKSLTRLLDSLSKAHYPDGEIRLVISLDNSGTLEPLRVAEAYPWTRGEKRVIHREKRMGLRNHVLACGDLTEEYGDVIVLEDDLFVSPFFYEYTAQALSFYANDSRIAGISLYSQQFNQTANLPFTPIDDGNADVYFMQLAASWGQAWSRAHWQGFRQWLDANGTDISRVKGIPGDIRSWPESSWLKLYNAYIISRDLYFVYPYRSLTTNFGDPGEHFYIASSRFQVAIQQQRMDYHFPSSTDSLAIYDAFGELLPATLKRLNPKLASYDFTVNLFGCKECRSGLQLTRTTKPGLHSFSLSMKPMELSVLHDVAGEGIALIDTAEVDAAELNAARTQYDTYRFFYKFPSVPVICVGFLERLQMMIKSARSS